MIETTDLTFTYAGADVPAVRDLSFAVPRGEIFGLLGPSGSGKSTTQKVLIGMLEGYRGGVRVLDRDRDAWTADHYERIGVSFEAPNHFLKLTGLENMRYFGALYRSPTRSPQEVLDMVGLGDDGAMPVGAYSKGMRNRLSIARCLLHGPDLLFLDEPTTGLDPVNARRIMDLVRGEREAGRTVFLTTHDMVVADELCDRIAFIIDGRIVCIETPRALKLAHGQRAVRVEYRAGDGLATEDFPLDGLADNEAFRARLSGSEVQTLHSREASLADVFIAVTGRTLE